MPKFSKKAGNKIAWGLAIFNVIVFTLMANAQLGYRELFAGFGSDLPAFTAFIMEFHNYTSIIGGLGVLGAFLVQFNRRQAGWILIGIASISIPVTMVLTVFANYLPIHTMGQVVG